MYSNILHHYYAFYPLKAYQSSALKIPASLSSIFLFFQAIWVFPIVARGSIILAAVKPDSQDRPSHQGTTARGI